MAEKIEDTLKNVESETIVDVTQDDYSYESGNCIENCPICGGVGWVRSDLPLRHPDFGKVDVCPNAPIENTYFKGRYGLLVVEQRQLSWDKFLDINNTIDVVDQVRDFLIRGWGWVYLWGGFGTAKSLILKTAISESLRMGKMARYATIVDIMDSVREAFDPRDVRESAQKRIDKWIRTPILAVDEFDKLRQTDWVMERTFKLMDSRYQTALGRQTITLISSNEPPDSLDGYLASRINDGRNLVLELKGKDARPSMREDDLF